MYQLEGEKAEKLLLWLEASGNIFSKYRLCRDGEAFRLLGKGACSDVYEAEDSSLPHSYFAVKVIGWKGKEVLTEEFEKNIENQRLLSEKTKYVVRVLEQKTIFVELGEDGEGKRVWEESEDTGETKGILLHFILMERLLPVLKKDRFGNVTLFDERLTRGEEIYRLAEQIGEALLTAHRLGILHRDVKLENIFYDAAGDCYKLGDFGASKELENGTAQTIIYTDGYGAPEIKKRSPENYGNTADIYSYGMVLYLLWNGLCFPASDRYTVHPLQYSEDFVFPAPKNGREELARLLRKACSYVPKERFAQMEEVLAALGKVRQAEEKPEVPANCGESARTTETYVEGNTGNQEGTESNEKKRYVSDYLHRNETYFTEKEITEILLELQQRKLPFPGYRLVCQNGELTVLGKGGFSAVYEAKSRFLHRPCAIKVMGFSEKQVKAELFQTAVTWQEESGFWCESVVTAETHRELCVGLDEKNHVTKVWTDGEKPAGGAYLTLQFVVMEKCYPILRTDKSKGVVPARKKLKEYHEREVLKLAYDVGQAILYMHKNGVYHRDVKLENILYSPLSGKYKLGDFDVLKKEKELPV